MRTLQFSFITEGFWVMRGSRF